MRDRVIRGRLPVRSIGTEWTHFRVEREIKWN